VRPVRACRSKASLRTRLGSRTKEFRGFDRPASAPRCVPWRFAHNRLSASDALRAYAPIPRPLRGPVLNTQGLVRRSPDRR
jgi:hypothetical protein